MYERGNHNHASLANDLQARSCDDGAKQKRTFRILKEMFYAVNCIDFELAVQQQKRLKDRFY
ncbi:hypothetical protein CWI83_03515 [Pseudidiomarina taiwanensis]|uniref:Uncharacterized protein n=1 Tax=Pseudidiomarina taiwanensis TaxID=337250 RepID=A0A432ZNV3_9GAMM|nr:hypothetical protein CWI83_03515 [Pseudidiomarina taiwanensis]